MPFPPGFDLAGEVVQCGPRVTAFRPVIGGWLCSVTAAEPRLNGCWCRRGGQRSLAKLAGAHVAAVASGPKLAFAAGPGADDLPDYRRADLAASSQRWDVILDCPAQHRFSGLRHLPVPDGVMVSARPISVDALCPVVPPRFRRDSRQ